VVRPEQQLIGAARVDLEPGARKKDQLRAARRPHLVRRAVTECESSKPGWSELRFGASSADIRGVVELEPVGPPRTVGADRLLEPVVTVVAV
jgi:hypothetical protein